MTYRSYCLVSGTLLGIVALVHLLRGIYRLPVIVDDYSVPLSASWLAVIIAGGLAVWAFRIAQSRN